MIRIVVFTSCFDGGIAQFTNEVAKQLCGTKTEVFLFVTDDYRYKSQVSNDIKVYFRPRVITFFPKNNKHRIKVMNQILDIKPDVVLFTDTSIETMQMSILLKNNSSVILINTLHDVKNHKSYFSIYKMVKNLYIKLLEKLTYSNFNKTLLLSKNSYNLFIRKYYQLRSKAFYYNLPPHPPQVQHYNLETLDFKIPYKNFILFFGRIDKYKGIDLLIHVYHKNLNTKLPNLIIAGKGFVKNDLKSKIDSLSNVYLYNDYVSDEMMQTLFIKSDYVVLPYIEATQSGIIPIAYYYRKPILVSDIKELKDSYLYGVTAVSFDIKDEKDLLLKLSKYSSYLDFNSNKTKNDISLFLNKNYSWDNLCKGILLEVERARLNDKAEH